MPKVGKVDGETVARQPFIVKLLVYLKELFYTQTRELNTIALIKSDDSVVGI